MTTDRRDHGSAERWGPLWGARPADWALSEDQQIPTYEEALRRVGLEPGQLRARHRLRRRGVPAPGRGSRRARRSASTPPRRCSRSPARACRTPICASATWRRSPTTTTPSTSSPASTRSSSPTTSSPRLREAGRVAKPGAPVVIQVWGPHERNDLEAMKEIVRPFMPPRPADAPPEPDYSKPGVLEDLATQAGLEPESAFDTTWAYEYPDEDTLRRALVAPAGIAVLVGPDREDEVKDAIGAGLAPLPRRRTGATGSRTRSTT